MVPLTMNYVTFKIATLYLAFHNAVLLGLVAVIT